MNKDKTTRQAAIFIGHGNPMNAITENPYRESWQKLGLQLKETPPRAILCISAHWQTKGTWVCSAEKPKTIHDFGGFPDALFAQQYTAPGAPDVAKLICDLIPKQIKSTTDWGLDHGTWTIMQSLFPTADTPVLQLSLDMTMDFAAHYALAKQLAILREKNILVIGSGNIVHNLALLKHGSPYDWAIAFDNFIKNALTNNDHQALINAMRLAQSATLAVPTAEHFLPLLYIAAMQRSDDIMTFFNTEFDLASLSMRSVIYQKTT